MATESERELWADLNRVLDENCGQGSPEYREAWAKWERMIRNTK